YDPKQYLDRLQLHYLLATARAVLDAAPESYPGIDWDRDEPALAERLGVLLPSPLGGGAGGGVVRPNPPTPFPEKEGGEMPARPLYVVVEKILGYDEQLPPDWACDGTTGYEFLNGVNGLFVDPAGEKPLTAFYQEFTGLTDSYPEVIYERKAQILSSSLYSE